jgi:hypothetical protein
MSEIEIRDQSPTSLARRDTPQTRDAPALLLQTGVHAARGDAAAQA